MKKTLLTIIAVSITLTAMLFLGEIMVRIIGIEPWKLKLNIPIVTPGGSIYEADDYLGYKLRPGQYRVQYKNGLDVTLAHDPLGNRITGNQIPQKSSGEIWIFGCSFTYGASLSDSETYPWKFQELTPQMVVRNFGVGGYGNVQSYIQFQKMMRQIPERPKVVVLSYASFHDIRNASLKVWRRSVMTYDKDTTLLKQPYVRFNKDNNLLFKKRDGEYKEFPFSRHLALFRFMEDLWIQKELKEVPSHSLSRAIIYLFDRMAKKQNIRFVLAGIDNDPLTRHMLGFAREQGIEAVDISVDLEREGMRNLPFDTHPSAEATAIYARKLEQYLKL